MASITPIAAAEYGLSTNNNGGLYQHGTPYSIEKKLQVATTYQHELLEHSSRPNISHVARRCKVQHKFVLKIEKELLEHGRVLDPKEIIQHRQLGPGSKTLDSFDMFILLFLYLEDNNRNLRSYIDHLWFYTGTLVSKDVISRFFLYGFPISGGFRKPNLIPIDKFRPENIGRAMEYLQFIMNVDPRRVKFGDEKLIKGSEIYSRKVRRNPITGEVPSVVTASDFRNTYPCIGFCAIDPYTPHLYWRIYEENNDAEQFSITIECAIVSGFFRGGDIIVLDNAAIHFGKENRVLEEWLWSRFGILVLFLPARTPEWNPQELVWRNLVGGLQKMPLTVMRGMTHGAAQAAHLVLSNITREQVRAMYKKCELFFGRV